MIFYFLFTSKVDLLNKPKNVKFNLDSMNKMNENDEIEEGELVQENVNNNKEEEEGEERNSGVESGEITDDGDEEAAVNYDDEDVRRLI